MLERNPTFCRSMFTYLCCILPAVLCMLFWNWCVALIQWYNIFLPFLFSQNFTQSVKDIFCTSSHQAQQHKISVSFCFRWVLSSLLHTLFIPFLRSRILIAFGAYQKIHLETHTFAYSTLKQANPRHDFISETKKEHKIFIERCYLICVMIFGTKLEFHYLVACCFVLVKWLNYIWKMKSSFHTKIVTLLPIIAWMQRLRRGEINDRFQGKMFVLSHLLSSC